MKFKHYSKISGLKWLYPKFHGTGKPGEESTTKRNYPEVYKDRLYLYHLEQSPESGLGVYLYSLDIPDKKILGGSLRLELWRKTERSVENILDRQLVAQSFIKNAYQKGYIAIDFDYNGAILLRPWRAKQK